MASRIAACTMIVVDMYVRTEIYVRVYVARLNIPHATRVSPSVEVGCIVIMHLYVRMYRYMYTELLFHPCSRRDGEIATRLCVREERVII